MNQQIVRIALALSMILLCGLPAHAAPGVDAPIAPIAPIQPQPGPGAMESGVYRLAAGDTISIKVVNFEELSSPMVVVPPDGMITVLLLDPIQVTGKTTAELAQLLAEKWRKFVVDPYVTVALVSPRTESVMFYGAVARVGPLTFRYHMRILDALAELGGAPKGDLSRVIVTHKNGDKQTLDLSHPETKSGTDADLELTPGDVIFVPEDTAHFTVLGDFARTGIFDYKDDMTVLDALTLVGGASPSANLSGAMILHNGKAISLDLQALLYKHDLSQNLKLAPGDVMTVPQDTNQFTVLGEVGRPGIFPYRDGLTVLDLITANAVLPSGDLDSATLTRDGKVMPLHLKELWVDHDLTQNTKIFAGDVIIIPLRKSEVGVFGEVGHAGNVPYKDDMTVLDALTAAGGVTGSGDMLTATLLHDGKESKLDLNALLKKGDLSVNVKLSPGDRILVPLDRGRPYIFGAVERPGFVDFHEGDRLLDVMTSAGGFDKAADLKRIHLIRVDRAKNTAVVSQVDFDKFFNKGDLTNNIPLQAGDILFVPTKAQKIHIMDIFSVLSSLSLVDSAVQLVTHL